VRESKSPDRDQYVRTDPAGYRSGHTELIGKAIACADGANPTPVRSHWSHGSGGSPLRRTGARCPTTASPALPREIVRRFLRSAGEVYGQTARWSFTRSASSPTSKRRDNGYFPDGRKHGQERRKTLIVCNSSHSIDDETSSALDRHWTRRSGSCPPSLPWHSTTGPHAP
jgi:hypothetical protein